jgi:hypothetical protein
MSNEREVRKERDFWGNEKEVVYDKGERVGEVKTEERGGFLGFGGETVRVEYDRSGVETSYTKQEERGGILGFGSETQEVRYDTSDKEIGHSRVESRGGFLGVGDHHVRVEYDNDNRELSQTNHERRGDFLGFGGERVRVTRYAGSDGGSATSPSGVSPHQASSAVGSSHGTAPPRESTLSSSGSRETHPESGSGLLVLVVTSILLISALYVTSTNNRQPNVKDTTTAQAEVLFGPPELPPNHKVAVDRWLALNTSFRVAMLSDCMCQGDLPAIYKQFDNRHPYYARGDFNADGVEDFAVVVVDRDVKPNTPYPNYFNASLLLFGGPITGKSNPAFMARAIGTPPGAQLFQSTDASSLMVGKWESSGALLVHKSGGYTLRQ